MPIIEFKTNLSQEQIPEGIESRFNNHFAPLWGKDPNVRALNSLKN